MRDYTYPATILTAKTLFKVLGMKFQMSGTEHIPRSGGAILAANHIGYVDFIFDGLAAQPSGRLVRFMAKKEAFDHKVTGPIMRSFHHISVDRDNGIASYDQAVAYARAGEIVGIFPEATISRSFEIKELKTGAVRMAAEAGVPLIPMVTWGTQLLKTKDHDADLTGRGKTIGLHVGAPLAVTGEDPVAETVRLREAMTGLLDHAIAAYPLRPEGQWWAPARHGGTAPTLAEAAALDEQEYAARAARRQAKDEGGS
jgi:1-acyl-sn-glycerol-3-phosphate acyltransferase